MKQNSGFLMLTILRQPIPAATRLKWLSTSWKSDRLDKVFNKHGLKAFVINKENEAHLCVETDVVTVWHCGIGFCCCMTLIWLLSKYGKCYVHKLLFSGRLNLLNTCLEQKVRPKSLSHRLCPYKKSRILHVSPFPSAAFNRRLAKISCC